MQMLNIEFMIILFIIVSFIIFHYFIDKEKEGACISTPFSFNPNKVTGPNLKDGSPSGSNGSSASVENSLIQTYLSILKDIQKDLTLIKSIIPIQFKLGIVDKSDTNSNINVYGKLPMVQLDFIIKNPPIGPTGKKGEDAKKYGDVGNIGKTGPIGENGYWGTTTKTLY